MFAFVVFGLVFSTEPRHYLGRMSPTRSILCRVGRKTDMHMYICYCVFMSEVFASK